MPATGRSYDAKRNFARTPEPAGAAASRDGTAKRGERPAGPLRFVVQKHDASRLHYDFRLEHNGALLSWAVPKGPSLDPRDKRLAVHVEDHPLEYADFEGTIPEGNYGAGTVEIWDTGHWTPLGDPGAGLADGDLKFRLDGRRYSGNFVLVRMKPKPRDHAENWLLIKERDGDPAEKHTRMGAPRSRSRSKPELPSSSSAASGRFRPQLATLVERAPEGPEWISEIKFDGYRLIAVKDRDTVRLLTRNGLDWTHRLPVLAGAIAGLRPGTAVLDGELVSIGPNGTTSFSALQAALSTQRDRDLAFMAFDLLILGDDDLRARPLSERKRLLEGICPKPRGRTEPVIRFSEHLDIDARQVSREACRMGLEGVVCKRLDQPYRSGRSRDWVKVKCDHRDEMIILGWTQPKASRSGLGAIHLGFHDDSGRLVYAGGCGTGFSDEVLASLSKQLRAIPANRPPRLRAPEKPPARLAWVEPVLVAEIGHAGFTAGGMIRHARFLGLREDKPASEVTRADLRPAPTPVPEPTPELSSPSRRARSRSDPATERQGTSASAQAAAAKPSSRFSPSTPRLTHPDRELWPDITKRDLAEYWSAIAEVALPGIAGRPLALLRCPEGIAGESFFQKHAMRGNPPGITEGQADGAPYLAISNASGLADLAQLSAIELHSWGSSLAAPTTPDRLVFDLDPDPSVGFVAVVEAARDIRRALEAIGMFPFVRTSGGKGLHLVVPVRPDAGWDEARAWTRAFATALEKAEPKRFIASSTRKTARSGKILIDWLRNGLGSTAIASFSPRARDGAPVATPLAWRDVTDRLDPTSFTVRTIPSRLARQRRDPWAGFARSAIAKLPDLGER